MAGFDQLRVRAVKVVKFCAVCWPLH